ncbi:MAG: hypothetical protein ACRD2D_06395, partial [Terriglobales bacterium]
MPMRSEIEPAQFSLREVSESILMPVQRPPSLRYLIWLGIANMCVIIGAAAWGRQLYIGMGVTGLGWPVMWAIYI